MTGWLLDTNIVSELQRAKPEPRVVAFFAASPLEYLFVSVVNLMEVRFGLEMATGEHRVALDRWLTDSLRPMFAGRVLPISEDVMLRWRKLVHEGRKVGRTYSEPDLIIAATALEYDLTLVTRNTRDFREIGLRLFNPWSDNL